MDIMIQELSPDNPEALAELAWHELVEKAERELPIMVIGNKVLKGDALVKNLSNLSESLRDA